MIMKFPLVVVSVLVGCALADWSAWSDWETCRCDSGQSRYRDCLTGDDCLGMPGEERPCSCVPFDAQVQCTMVKTDDSLYGLAADGCNCNQFYQCDLNATSGMAYGIMRKCGACEVWDDTILSCVVDVTQPDCIIEIPTTEGVGNCTLNSVPNEPNRFSLDGVEMDCSPGTKWNQTLCTCVYVTPQFMMLGITCITFTTGRTDPSHGVWASDRGLAIADTDQCGLAGPCAKFNQSAESRISLPYFSNAMPQFSKFSMSFWFKRSSTSSGGQTLLTNADCMVPASLEVNSSPASIDTAVKNETGYSVLDAGVQGPDDQWNHYVMVYDGLQVIVYMNGLLVSQNDFLGKIATTKAPFVLGASLCENKFYDGYMDTISFAKGALNQDHVNFLFANPDMCLP